MTITAPNDLETANVTTPAGLPPCPSWCRIDHNDPQEKAIEADLGFRPHFRQFPDVPAEVADRANPGSTAEVYVHLNVTDTHGTGERTAPEISVQAPELMDLDAVRLVIDLLREAGRHALNDR